MKATIYFRFEKFNMQQRAHSIQTYTKLNRDTTGNFLMEHQKGFRFSQVVDLLLYYYSNNTSTNETVHFDSINSEDTNGYIIPVAVQYHPNDWTDMTNGIQDTNRLSIFELINPIYLKDMQDGKALLLIDQSVEGYSTAWLWEWFHNKCKKYNLNPSSIIYLTGDQSCSDQYKEWCDKNKPLNALKVIPSISLSMYIRKHCVDNKIIPQFNELLLYKKENSNSLYLYDSINLRPRPQRVLNFMNLVNEGLFEYGNISMPDCKEWKSYVDLNDLNFLKKYKIPQETFSKIEGITPSKANFTPIVKSSHYYNFVERVLFDVYKNSWVSVITESSYFDYEHSVFISEKTFKPIACMQPFIIVGSKNSLKYLRDLGYKTFHPYIDETYDTLEDVDRIKAVSDAIKKIQAIKDKVEWYNNIKEIVEHNYKIFTTIGVEKSIEHIEINKYYFNYFGNRNV